MVQPRRGPRLTQAPQLFGNTARRWQAHRRHQLLGCYLPIQQLVARVPDPTHSTRRDQRQQPIPAADHRLPRTAQDTVLSLDHHSRTTFHNFRTTPFLDSKPNPARLGRDGNKLVRAT
jgi:hypothetical protein